MLNDLSSTQRAQIENISNIELVLQQMAHKEAFLYIAEHFRGITVRMMAKKTYFINDYAVWFAIFINTMSERHKILFDKEIDKEFRKKLVLFFSSKEVYLIKNFTEFPSHL